jgi:hypothetical protein
MNRTKHDPSRARHGRAPLPRGCRARWYVVVLSLVAVVTVAQLVPLGGGTTSHGGDFSVAQGPAPTYWVNFTESGLDSGTNWSVMLSGQPTASARAGQVIGFQVPNGSYTFSVPAIACYTANPSSGPVIVLGNNSTEAISFTGACSATFSEAGLPSLTAWSITLNGTTLSALAPTRIVFSNLAPGSYAFSVGTVPGYGAQPSSGTITITNNNPPPQNIQFSATQFAVTFDESGLPTGTSWSVTLGSQQLSSTSSTIVFTEVDGTYSFTVGSVPGFRASPSSGSITVNGTDVTKAISFSTVTYSLTFSESGLASGTSWSVTVNGATRSSSTSSIVFNEPNGTYPWTVAHVPGYQLPSYTGTATVNGGPYTVSLTWTASLYPLYFNETGLPPKSSWFVYVDGNATQPSTTKSIEVLEPNGPHYWSAPLNLGGYVPFPAQGNVNVSGQPQSVGITWAQGLVPLSFHLVPNPPNGSAWVWWVNVNAVSNQSSAPGNGTVTVPVQGGRTYSFIAGGLPVGAMFDANNPTSVSVPGGQPVNVSLNWSESVYSVSMPSIGLPTGTFWSVSVLSNATQTRAYQGTSGSTLTFTEPAGAYGFNVKSPANYAASPESGWFSVSPSGTVTWKTWINDSWNVTTGSLVIHFVRALYIVTFVSAQGLPAGTVWTVILGGAINTTANTSLNFWEPNGSFPYSVSAPGYRAHPPSGIVNVTGVSPSPISITWTVAEYSIYIEAFGLPLGTQWAATIAGRTAPGTTNSSAVGSWIAFDNFANGTYNYSVGFVSGFSAYPSSGHVIVDGKDTWVGVLYTQSSKVGQGQRILGLPALEAYTLLVGLPIFAVLIVMAAILWFRPPKGPPFAVPANVSGSVPPEYFDSGGANTEASRVATGKVVGASGSR